MNRVKKFLWRWLRGEAAADETSVYRAALGIDEVAAEAREYERRFRECYASLAAENLELRRRICRVDTAVNALENALYRWPAYKQHKVGGARNARAKTRKTVAKNARMLGRKEYQSVEFGVTDPDIMGMARTKPKPKGKLR